jgi:hypothetical protein
MMGVSYCVIFESEVSGLGKIGGDNNPVARALDELQAVASEAGLTPLQSFESYGADDVEGMEDIFEGEVPDLPPSEFFDTAEGLAAVEAITRRLREAPGTVPWVEEIIPNLEVIASELAKAKAAGIRFRFAWVM